ncbi:MAG: hypothetical protein AB7I30_16130, partial [Isosphaeraceae bacterium]
MNDKLWGLVMVCIGCFFLVSGRSRSDFSLYRFFVARSRILWGESTHVFFQFVGIAIMVVGI